MGLKGSHQTLRVVYRVFCPTIEQPTAPVWVEPSLRAISKGLQPTQVVLGPSQENYPEIRSAQGNNWEVV